MEYYNRVSDNYLRLLLDAMGAVLIEGPKWCGKTTTAEQFSQSSVKLQDPDMREDYAAMVSTRPSLMLQGDTPRLIDEWQDFPVLWDAVRVMVDKRSLPGQFILTGSNSIEWKKVMHSGTGRIARMHMLPMSLWESRESNGEVSLMQLFDNPQMDIEAVSNLSLEGLIYAACRGGWPSAVKDPNPQTALVVASQYVRSVCERDISHVDNTPRNPKLAHQILRSYARNISTLAKTTSMLQDVVSSDKFECSRPTFDDYVAALEKLFVIQDIDPWCPAVRSKSNMRSGVKRGFCDPSIAVTLLGLNPDSMLMQLRTFGFIFEQLCIRDLKAYIGGAFSDVAYYNDRYGLEADVVLHLDDGRYALIECKLGSGEIELGAKHLLKLKSLIIEHNKDEKQVPIREPDLLIILTGGQYGYRRQDGVYVIPIGCLKD